MVQQAGDQPHILTLTQLKTRKLTRFALRPDAQMLRAIQDDLGLHGLRKLAFEGTLEPDGREDWRLTARLGATAVQPCAVTLAPVTTRVDTDVVRMFVAQMPDAASDEEDEDGNPMIGDDTLEPLGREINLIAVASEALALALPDYPRAPDADLGAAVFTEPGKDPMTDETAKPFAALAGLKDKLGSQE